MTGHPDRSRATFRTRFLHGVLTGAPFLIIVAPFAMVFGVAATEAGLSIMETMAFSILVVGGASQFAALQLLTENAATILALTAALVVNLRMAMYSAALAPHLGENRLSMRILIGYLNFDQSFTVATTEYDRNPDATLQDKTAFFLGVAIPTGLTWWIFTYVGAVAGNAIPPQVPLDFAVPITFLAMLGPILKSLAHVAAALTSVVLALALGWLPSGTGLLIAAVGAMAVGAEIERRMARA